MIIKYTMKNECNPKIEIKLISLSLIH